MFSSDAIFSIDQVGWLNNDRSQFNAMTATSVQRDRQRELWQDVENDFYCKSIKVGINGSSCKKQQLKPTDPRYRHICTDNTKLQQHRYQSVSLSDFRHGVWRLTLDVWL